MIVVVIILIVGGILLFSSNQPAEPGAVQASGVSPVSQIVAPNVGAAAPFLMSVRPVVVSTSADD